MNWYAGEAYASIPGTFKISSPSNAYLSAFISSGNNLTTTLSITLIVNKINYKYMLPIKWKGWRLIQLKLSDFKNTGGNSIESISNGATLDFGLNCASKAGQETEVDLDFIML